MTSTPLSRKFRIGAALLDDPAPDLTPEEAVRLYEATYPHIAHCSVEEGGVEGDVLIYNVVKPPAQTKGSGRQARSLPPADEQATLAKLDAWASGEASDQPALKMHTRVGHFLFECLRRPSDILDPMIVPYA